MKKSNRILQILLMIISSGIGIYVSLIPFLSPQAEYGELSVEDITIERVEKRSGGGRFSDYYCIVTTDNEQYNVGGNIINQDFFQLKNIDAIVKYYPSESFDRKYAEEVLIDNTIYVEYDNQRKTDTIMFLVFGILIFCIGIGLSIFLFS